MPIPRAQSAMQYLITYGWAILVIVVVFSLLYTLGFFKSGFSVAGTPPGSCKVFRPNGPKTLQFISLQGTCNSEKPESVGQFSGGNNYVVVNSKFFQGNSFTILAWVYWPPGTNFAPSDLGYAWSGPGVVDQGFGMFSRSDDWYLNFYADDLACSTGPAAGQWYQFGSSWNSATKLQTIWVNGAAACSRTSTGSLVTGMPLIIGSGSGSWDTPAYMGGSIADVQVYNASLSANEIQQMYYRGIGGDPINIQNLVGWWPLNGDTLDYSGNGNNGVPSGMSFSDTWASSYTPP
ncbi:MAG: LamG domain-containing protein [Candidatus Micrarchaeaceae archaeon]